MPAEKFLHHHPKFKDLILIVSKEQHVEPYLAEKDYWIMHCLYGLQQGGYEFFLKGGTSLSKGHRLIHRFSEDIDTYMVPPEELGLKIGKNHNKQHHIAARKDYYDRLAQEIEIEGVRTERDTEFDDESKYRSGGARLIYKSHFDVGKTKAKQWVLLELGFDNIAPNEPKDISSWVYDRAVSDNVRIIDNRALGVRCYDAGYTFVEKLQAISTKYRNLKASGEFQSNYVRHYYDVYCLLKDASVNSFAKTEAFEDYRQKRFPAADFVIPLSENQAFLLHDQEDFDSLKKEYAAERSFYHQGQPKFEEVVAAIREWVASR